MPTIQSFTAVGTTSFVVPAGVVQVTYLVVAGGGGGNAGGGGAGGLLTGTLNVNPGASLTVTVGGGGAGTNVAGDAANGGNSVFSSITATGGGGGSGGGTAGAAGGSGGGGFNATAGGAGTGGQGNNGGGSTVTGAGGGGGAGAVGGAGGTNVGGNGGAGTSSSISGSAVTYAGGGGSFGTTTAGTGGSGGGGNGSATVGGGNGTTNTGGGGGGGGTTGGNGGSGIVILSYSIGAMLSWSDSFSFLNAPRPKIRVIRDFGAFNPGVPAPPVQTPSILTYYPPFDPAPRPHNFARDWIAFSGSILAETFPPVGFDFTPFDLGRHAPNFGRDWITQFGDIKVDTFPLDPVDFLDFSPGKTARFFGNRQPPPWTTYYLNTRFFPKRDTHDGLPRRHRHPSVYSDDYYDRLRKRRERHEEEPIPAVERVPNLLIPLNRLIMPVAMPTLINAPPFRPVPSLHLNPPPFRMATPEEIEADDAMIIKMLLEE